MLLTYFAKLYALREKCRYSDLIWSVFFPIRTEYEDLGSKSPNSVQMRENTDKKTPNTNTFFAVMVLALPIDKLWTRGKKFLNFLFCFYSFENAWKVQSWSFLSRKKKNLFTNVNQTSKLIWRRLSLLGLQKLYWFYIISKTRIDIWATLGVFLEFPNNANILNIKNNSLSFLDMHILYCVPTVLSFKNIKLSFNSEVAVQRCSVKKVFLETSQNSQESTSARVFF